MIFFQVEIRINNSAWCQFTRCPDQFPKRKDYEDFREVVNGTIQQKESRIISSNIKNTIGGREDFQQTKESIFYIQQLFMLARLENSKLSDKQKNNQVNKRNKQKEKYLKKQQYEYKYEKYIKEYLSFYLFNDQRKLLNLFFLEKFQIEKMMASSQDQKPQKRSRSERKNIGRKKSSNENYKDKYLSEQDKNYKQKIQEEQNFFKEKDRKENLERKNFRNQRRDRNS